MSDLNNEQIQRALLVRLELGEAIDRMRAEGFKYDELLGGIAALANDLITGRHNQATASAWFFGMAKQAATIAARDMGLGEPGEG